jgi:hypothetical protein
MPFCIMTRNHLEWYGKIIYVGSFTKMTGYDAEEEVIACNAQNAFKDPIQQEGELVKLHALQNWESHEMTTPQTARKWRRILGKLRLDSRS